MTNLLQEAFAVVSQLPDAEQNAIAQLILQQIAQRDQAMHKIPIDFMQFAGIASAEESIVLQTLEHEIEEQRSLDLQRQLDL
ncbi:MAG: hypothetical protein HEQ35_21580 [Gloeotrichia echinulata IR180]|nr:hypothetical protein [Gloeotrichia echinulata DEX184]